MIPASSSHPSPFGRPSPNPTPRRDSIPPPSPKSSWPAGVPMISSSSILIPGTSEMGQDAVAGPSFVLPTPRRRSRSDSPSPPRPPSSAPPTPSVIAMTHPSQYIHTHHPRRGSMTPLGLNVISPVSPIQFSTSFSPSPMRSVGFSPSGSAPQDAVRRESVTSSSSTLTQSRPASSVAYPSGFNRERRRSSLTPSQSTLAPASPSRTLVTARISRPSTSEGSGPPASHAMARTGEGAPSRTTLNQLPGATKYGRRGSLPHLTYGGWTGPQTAWNPSLPPQRGSVGEDQPDEGFKFGSGVNVPSAAAAALRAVDISPGSRRGSFMLSSKRREDRDAFEDAEAEEAERQRRAFLAATYGGDAKRARERLSIGGPSTTPAGGSPGTSSSTTLRRPSLALWEKMHMSTLSAKLAAEVNEPTTSASAPVGFEPLASLIDPGPRRGSLPIAIPGGRLGRSPSRRMARAADLDAPPKSADSQGKGGAADDDADDDIQDTTFHAPLRPLPPMMPLSDPGPRLLPSTLALHRANHLLNSRNLQSEPLPHPLPPSLHPPAPVDLAEFDIDFILGGSLTQLGGDKLSKNAPVDVAPRRRASIPSTPTLKLGPGGVDEDTFAKFVGEFDDEYGDRRGEWTFRACNPHASAAQSPTLDSGLLTGEWESAGAGRYELFANGEVRSAQQGRVWRVRKIAKHEYELEEMKRGKEQPSEAVKANESAQRSTGIHTSDCYILACKSSHCEEGGVKLPTLTQRDIVSPKTASASKQNSGPKLRISFSDSSATERTARVGSSASTARTMAAFSQSLPLSSVFLTPRKKSQASSRGTSETVRERGRASISHAPGRKIEQPEMMKRKDRTVRPQNKEHDSNDKRRDRSLGGVFKRGIMAPFKSSVAAHEEKKALKDQRERERLQSQSWSRSGSIRTRSPRSSPGKSKLVSPVPERSVSTLGPLNTSQIAPSSFTEKGNESWLAGFHQEDRRPLPSPKPQLDDVEGLTFREGKAWHYVPDEAVAMVVPIDNDENRTPRDRTPHYSPFFVEGTRQALLVWYVPFNSETDERSTTASTSASSSRPGSDSSSSRPVTDFSYSLPKFQKLLRRHASKEKEATKRHRPDSSRDLDSDQLRAAKVSCFLHPLPFRSFRVVARVVDVDDLRSEPYGPATSFEQWREQQHRLIPQEFARTASASSSNPSPNRPHSSLPLFDDADTASGSTAPTSTIMAGRTFPTVIAVCHSRNQGVEFVLEGLDRLGFCKGESAWGPTGYEEWRGSGLSDKGRDLLDLLWAGCTGVMGLSAQ